MLLKAGEQALPGRGDWPAVQHSDARQVLHGREIGCVHPQLTGQEVGIVHTIARHPAGIDFLHGDHIHVVGPNRAHLVLQCQVPDIIIAVMDVVGCETQPSIITERIGFLRPYRNQRDRQGEETRESGPP